ncbi:MAG TPA: pentapeptide repeat-containing protein [Gaiellaceae bacterium]|nr:pentapeptide repeat-containing protein [Gaiellaceae bacterium]
MTAKKELVARWSAEPGRTILERVHAFFFETQMPGHGRSSSELFALLDQLPYRDEVDGDRDFRGAPLGGGTRDLDLSRCDFSYATLTINLVNCDLTGAIFDEAVGGDGMILDRLDGASFVHARLRRTHFQGARAHGCTFDGATLAGASFEAADLTGSSFRDADCRRAKFLRAKLIGCDLRGATLDEAVLQEVEIDETTDLRGASLVNAYDQELRDREGNVVAHATDWTRAKVDPTTRYGEDRSSRSNEIVEVTLRLLDDSSRPWAAGAAEELRRARGADAQDGEWYAELLANVDPDVRPELEALVAEATRSLL